MVPQSSQAVADFAWGLDRFLDEARTLARFDHRHIIKVYHFFEAHGTAYIVMEYAEGETLSEFLQSRGVLSAAELKAILYPILDGLELVHRADFLHRDIKPGNIIIRDEDHSPVLLDFGAARQAIGTKSRSITSIVTPGYAPIEQYSPRGDQGAWTDIYALGAVCYQALTGQVPDDATERVRRDSLISVSECCAGQASVEFLSAIDSALQVNEEARPQSIAEWRDALEEEKPPPPPPPVERDREQVDVPPVPVHQHTDDQSEPPQKSRGKLLAALSCIVALLIGGVSYYQYAYLPRFKDCVECPEMVEVPSGSFTMGSHHRVQIGYPLAVGVYEVTFSEWDACVNLGGCGGYIPDDRGWGRGNRPVMNVSWDDAKSYVRWLSQKTGHRYGLLSESEWEYVARAGTTTAYSWGNEIGRNRANCHGCGSIWDSEKTAPVGSFRANAWGIHDMHGNVWEWVEDCSNYSYVGALSDGSAWTSGDCDYRVLRGGSWLSGPRSLRSANRNRGTSVNRFSYFGFRVVRRF